MNLLHKIASGFAAKPDLFLPYQHLVSSEHVDFATGVHHYKSLGQFKKEIDLVLKWFYPLSPEQLREHLEYQTPIPKRSVLFSFDMGLRNQYEIMAPVLQEKGIPALFMIRKELIGNNKIWFPYCKGCLLHVLQNELLSISQQVSLYDLLGHPSQQQNRILQFKESDSSLLQHIESFLGIEHPNQKDASIFMDEFHINQLQSKGFTIGEIPESVLPVEQLKLIFKNGKFTLDAPGSKDRGFFRVLTENPNTPYAMFFEKAIMLNNSLTFQTSKAAKTFV
jgi:hypothetical protein